MTKLKLEKARAGLYNTSHDGLHIDFYKLPSDGLWRSSFFECQVPVDHRDYCRAFLSLKIAKMVCERHLQAGGLVQ